MMNNIYIYVILSIIIISCSSKNIKIGKEDIEGKYTRKEQKWIELHFEKDNFFFLDTSQEESLSTYDCCDTLSYGKWEIDPKGLIILTSTRKLDNYFMNIEVSESKSYSKDSLYFVIKNPIEEYYEKTKRKEKNIFYKIDVFTDSITNSLISLNKRYSSNVITVYKENSLKLNSFNITVIVDPEIRLKYLNSSLITTVPYKVNSIESNVFEINIPQLSFNYLSYKVLNNDYLKIVNNDKLIWDGHEYIKE